MYTNLFEFYRSREWEDFRKVVIAERIADDGHIYDEYTGKPIVKAYDIVLHHKEELTEENVRDVSISLNPDNIMIVSHKTHNYLHNKLGYKEREVYLVYGAPCSGKTTWVLDNMEEGDLVIDMDNIWQAISGQPRYIKPSRLNTVAFKVRTTLIDCIQYRLGKWRCAYLIGGYPLQSEREQLCKALGAKEVFIDTSKEECMARLEASDRNKDEWTQYIDEWFERYRLTVCPPEP